MNEYIEKWVVEFKKTAPNFGLLEDIELFFKIVFYLIAIGIAAPIVLWLARRIYRSVKKTRAEIGK